MKALDLLNRVKGIEDIEESITLTWDSESNTGHNQTWIKNVGKKYAKQLGKFLREVDVKTSKGNFWILVYEKGAFAGQTVREGVGRITHAGLVELGKKKGRWTLTSNNVLESSVGKELKPIPDNIRSARQLMNMLEEASATKEVAVVTESDAQEVEKHNSETIFKPMLEEYFRTTLPPMSSINYNEKNQMFLIKSPQGRQLFGCIWKMVGAGLYNVAIQGIDGRSQNLSKIDSPYEVITSRLRDMLQDPDVRQTIAVDALAYFAGKVDKNFIVTVAGDEAIIRTTVDKKKEDLVGRLTFRRGLVRFYPKYGEVVEESVSLNDLTIKMVKDVIEEGTQPEFDDDFLDATNRWSEVDDSLTFKRQANGFMKVYNDGKAVGYMDYDGNSVNLYDGSFEVQSVISTDQHSVTVDVDGLDESAMNESMSSKVNSFLKIIS